MSEVPSGPEGGPSPEEEGFTTLGRYDAVVSPFGVTLTYLDEDTAAGFDLSAREALSLLRVLQERQSELEEGARENRGSNTLGPTSANNPFYVEQRPGGPKPIPANENAMRHEPRVNRPQK